MHTWNLLRNLIFSVTWFECWKKVCLTLVSLLTLLMSARFFNANRKALRNANRFPTSCENLGPAEKEAVAGSSQSGAGSLGRACKEAGGQWALRAAGCPLAPQGSALEMCRRSAFPGQGLGPGMSLLHLGADLKSKVRSGLRAGGNQVWRITSRPRLEEHPRGPRWPAALQGSGPGNGRGGWAEGNLWPLCRDLQSHFSAYWLLSCGAPAKWWTLLSTNMGLRPPGTRLSPGTVGCLSGDAGGLQELGVTRGLRCLLSAVSRKLGQPPQWIWEPPLLTSWSRRQEDTLMTASWDPEQRITGESGLVGGLCGN